MKKRFKGKITIWEVVQRILRVVEVTAIVAGVIGLYFAYRQVSLSSDLLKHTVEQIAHIKRSQSAEMMLKFEEKISTKLNSEIFSAIDSGLSVLNYNGGRLTTSELNDYLGIFNSLNDIHEEGLITYTMVYDSLSDMILKTFRNNEIQEYLKQIRTINAEYFGGFYHIAEAMSKFE